MQHTIILSFLALCLAAPAWALDAAPFTEARFQQLQAEGELVLVDVFAAWCPTCARQEKILESYMAEHPDTDLRILRVDYDRDKEVVRRFKAPRQSTLLLFRDGERLWYSVAETDRDVIFEAINRAANAR